MGLPRDQHEWLVSQLPKRRINKNQSPKILYQGSVHGMNQKGSAQRFHQLCDGQGPTVVLVKLVDGHIFGGYTSLSWSSPESEIGGEYKSDRNAFLFSLTDGKGRPPSKCPIKAEKVGYAVIHGSNFGPIFGDGRDLYISLDNLQSSYSILGDTYQVPTGFDQYYLAGKVEQWQIADVIVYLWD